MSRGIGEFELVQGAIPEWLAVFVAVLTQLGDVWFLSVLVAVVYWTRTDRRDDVAVVAGVTLAGFAFMAALKHVFALPRPDQPLLPAEELPTLIQPLYEATATAAGYGFPSGHALMTTVVYLSLVDLLAIGSRRSRLAGAISIITLVSVSRIALGVHYLVDIVAGVGLGLVFLAVTAALVSSRPSDRATIAFALAVGLGGLNLLVSGVTANALVLAGASLGAFGGWQLVVFGRRLRATDHLSTAAWHLLTRAALAVAALVPLFAALGTFEFFSAGALGGLVGLGVATLLALPFASRSIASGTGSRQ
ncbi:phosphatase PAP2 family protein [Halobacteria archaeon AArc-m2/3/4]|uniref:Phosphatase PAP2 family protein n=1 Tax=Natronoglomus mannanivorans TaxID=2979990 RepID=A0AAP2Z242_9EURY|nr:phosphatase PAP2 family protein [Halobacteria archaeon AArc-xg1-1]MCU4974188.1 phosphatase PAP2 family protein [Halobacteria archaeon AArc-m2/3/4]